MQNETSDHEIRVTIIDALGVALHLYIKFIILPEPVLSSELILYYY